MSALDDLLDSFALAEAHHPAVVVQLQAATIGAAEGDKPLGLDEALARFALDERQRALLLSDGTWVTDLLVFLGRVAQKIDPSLRAAFPAANALIESFAAGLPGGALVAHLLLTIAEGPLLALLEGWLVARAQAIEAARLAAKLD